MTLDSTVNKRTTNSLAERERELQVVNHQSHSKLIEYLVHKEAQEANLPAGAAKTFDRLSGFSWSSWDPRPS